MIARDSERDRSNVLGSLVPDTVHVYQCSSCESEFINVWEGQTAPEFEPESWFETVKNERKKVAVRGDHRMPAALLVHDPPNDREAARLGSVVRFAPKTCRCRSQPRRLDHGLEVHTWRDYKFSLAKISHNDRLNPKATCE